MNGNRKQFDRLVEAARREPIPQIDVADWVAESIRPRVQPPNGDWTLWVASALAVAAAVLVMAVASYQGALATDPLAELVNPGFPVMQ